MGTEFHRANGNGFIRSAHRKKIVGRCARNVHLIITDGRMTVYVW
jgi:hypothetical protein